VVVKEAFYENKENSYKKFVVPIKCNEYLIERHIRIFDLSRDRPIFRHKKLDSSGCTVHPEKEKRETSLLEKRRDKEEDYTTDYT
jgi:hypothetical protein